MAPDDKQALAVLIDPELKAACTAPPSATAGKAGPQRRIGFAKCWRSPSPLPRPGTRCGGHHDESA